MMDRDSWRVTTLESRNTSEKFSQVHFVIEIFCGSFITVTECVIFSEILSEQITILCYVMLCVCVYAQC